MRRQKDILYLLISGFVLSVILVISNVYHNHATSTISETLQLEVLPIEPRFDKTTLEKIKQRTKVDPRFEVSTSVASTSAPSPTIKPSAAVSPTFSPTVTATPSGR